MRLSSRNAALPLAWHLARLARFTLTGLVFLLVLFACQAIFTLRVE